MTEITRIPDPQNLPSGGSTGLEELIAAFLADAQVGSGSKAKYKKLVRQYLEWLVASGLWGATITLTQLLKYKADLEEQVLPGGAKLSNMTVASRMGAVKQFYNWAESKGLVRFNPSKFLKSPKKENKFKRKPLTQEQGKQLLEYFKNAGSLRNYAMVNAMIRRGFRRIEVSRMDVGDIEETPEGRRIWVRGKGQATKNKWVKIPDKVYEPIAAYLATRGDLPKDAPLFCSEGSSGGGGRLIEGTISEMVKVGLVAIGLPGREYTCHSLRHTAGTNLMRAGGTKEQARDMLRHVNTKTTDGYTAIHDEEERMKNDGSDIADNML